MTSPTTAREALIAEAIGEVAELVGRVEALMPALDSASHALLEADAQLRDHLSGLERRMAAITEKAKDQTARHIAECADQATRRSMDQQSRAMADAARVAFGAEIGATMQRLHSTLEPLLSPRKHGPLWGRWLSHAATAAAASALTWALAAHVGVR
jgi:hypothetical protein